MGGVANFRSAWRTNRIRRRCPARPFSAGLLLMIPERNERGETASSPIRVTERSGIARDWNDTRSDGSHFVLRVDAVRLATHDTAAGPAFMTSAGAPLRARIGRWPVVSFMAVLLGAGDRVRVAPLSPAPPHGP